MERASEARRWPLVDMAVLLMVAALLWLVPMLLNQSRAGVQLPVTRTALAPHDAEVQARAEALALELAAGPARTGR